MYLTHIYLNPHRRGVKQLMRGRQTLHAAALNCFPPSVLDDPGASRVLWRLDCPPAVRGTAPRQGSPSCSLYISNPVVPDLSHIVEEVGYATEGGVIIRDMSSFLKGLRAGQQWGFRLYVNPTFREGSQVNARGRKKVLAHATQDQQTQWVLERAEKCGFRVLTSAEPGGELLVLEDGDRQHVDGANLPINDVERSIAKFRRGEHRVTPGVAIFEGVLEVTGSDALRRVLIRGIGRGKAYGCGLMTLARS